MKYWNKDRDVRRRCWVTVKKTNKTISNEKLKQWCQQNDSTGKFYFYYGSDDWWFEQEQDAMLFKLKWS